MSCCCAGFLNDGFSLFHQDFFGPPINIVFENSKACWAPHAWPRFHRRQHVLEVEASPGCHSRALGVKNGFLVLPLKTCKAGLRKSCSLHTGLHYICNVANLKRGRDASSDPGSRQCDPMCDVGGPSIFFSMKCVRTPARTFWRLYIRKYPVSSLREQAAMQSIVVLMLVFPEGNSEQKHLLENFPCTNEVERMKLFTFKVAYHFLPWILIFG